MKKIMTAMMVVAVIAAAVAAEMPTEPRGGQPPKGSKPSVKNFADQVTYQRAFEAVVWSMPAVMKFGFNQTLGGIT